MIDATEGRIALRGDRGDGASPPGLRVPPAPLPVSPNGALPALPRFAAIDGLRAVALLAVLVANVGDATGVVRRTLHLGSSPLHLNLAVHELQLGIEIFFVLSAFLLYRPFVAAHVDRVRHTEPLRFLWRRAWRIYPAYWVALTVVVALSYRSLSYGGGANNGDLRIAHYLLVWGYDLRWIGANVGLRHAWPLVVEVSFCAFVPLWAWLMRGAGGRLGAMRAEVVGALLLLTVSPWMTWNLSAAQTPSPLRVLPPYITAFAIGMLLATADVWHERREQPHPAYERVLARVAWAWPVALLTFLVFVQTVGIDPLRGPTPRQLTVERTMHALIAGLVAAPVLLRMRRNDATNRALRARPLVALGVVSYGVYLWHVPLIDALRHQLDSWQVAGTHDAIVRFTNHMGYEFVTFLVLVGVGAVVLGTLSWFVVERPAIDLAAGRAPWLAQLRSWIARRWRRPSFYTGLTGISLVALAWRVGYVLAEQGRLRLAGDAFYYHTQANDIAHGRWFIDPSQYAFYGRVTPSAGHPPTYLLYLAGVSKFIGTSELTHRLASTLLGAAAVFFIGVLARMLFEDDRAGWIAAAVAAVYAHLWINDEMLMSEGMYQLWTVIAVMSAYCFWRNPRRSTAAWMGGAIAMSALSRAEATTLFPLLVIPLALGLRAFAMRERVKLAAIACVVGALVMSPWVLYNMGRFVHPVVMSNGIGSTIMVANCDITYKQPYLGYWSVGCAQTFPVLQHGDESEKEVAWRKQGIDYIKHHLDRQPEMVTLRVARMWDLGFIGQNIFPFNGALEGRGIWQSLLATLQYLVIMPLAIHGLVLLYRRRRTIIPFVAVAATITITAASTFGITRYRAPVDALLPALAAGAIIYRLDRSRRSASDAAEPPVTVPTAASP